MSETSYNARVEREIETFRDLADFNALPPVFHRVSHAVNFPRFRHVFGVESVADFYAQAVMEAAPDGDARIISVGCGDGSIEFDGGRSLFAKGYRRFELVCAEISPPLLERLRQALPDELAGNISTVVCDLNSITIPGKFDCVMANQSLHHVLELECLFDWICEHLTDEGIFATSDVIGRNGHMRWPEAEAFLQVLWTLLPEHQRVNRLLSRVESRFMDNDCSTEGFEGVRAQDVLPLILNRLHPKRFFGFGGGIIDLLIDRAYGHNFDVQSPTDMAFIDAATKINDYLVDAGLLKPTQMFAHFTKRDLGERCYRQRTAARSVRDLAAPVLWAVTE